jgi:hypothetical protein
MISESKEKYSLTKRLAPVLVTVYNRLSHLEACILSLKACRLSMDTNLFIAIDAPYRSEDIEINIKIREYIKGIKGFRNVTLLAAEKNIGSFNNFFNSVNDVFKQYDRVIFLEDDNIVLPHFLEYMNESLEVFNGNPNIFSVSGYNYPVTTKLTCEDEMTYLWKGFSAWGVGMWKEKWNRIDWSDKYTSKHLFSFRKIIMTMAVANHVLPILFYSNKKGRKIGDAIITINIIDKGLYSIFPKISLVKNIGNDGQGESAKVTTAFLNQPLDISEKVSCNPEVKEIKTMNQSLYKYFRISNINKVKFLIRLIVLK